MSKFQVPSSNGVGCGDDTHIHTFGRRQAPPALNAPLKQAATREQKRSLQAL